MPRSRACSTVTSFSILAAVCGAVLVTVMLAGPDRLEALDCPRDVLPDGIDGQLLLPEEEVFLDEFGRALGRFKGMTLDEFRAEFGPGKNYLRGNGPGFIRGDANRDGKVDLADAVCVLAGLFLGRGACADAACLDPQDVDDSGRVNITDPIALLGYLFTGGREPPPPFREAGDDPTADGLACEASSKLGYEPLAAEFLDVIFSRYFLSEEQEAAFREHGFVVLENARFDTFFHGLHETWTRDMPVYVSVDAILDALSLSLDRMLQAIEEQVLIGELDSMLEAMEGGIDGLTAHAGGRDIAESLDDVALWLCVGRSLLAGEKTSCPRGVDGEIDEILALVAAEKLAPLTLFGHDHCEDFSQFKPRGHYTRSEALERYFRSMMWVQRIPLKLAQFPRHAALAFLLTRLLEDTGAMAHWEKINAVVEAIVGVSDSANPPALSSFLERNGFELPDIYDPAGFRGFVVAALEDGLGKQRINGQILMLNPLEPADPAGFTPIPPAFHLMGQRFVIDSFVFQNVVWDRVCRRECPLEVCRDVGGSACGRLRPSPLDVWFAFGNRAALPLLETDLETYDYHAHLAALEWLVSAYPPDFWNESLYNVWLSALRELDEDTTSPEYPPVMRTEAWDRRMLQTQLASWAQLRHATILYPKPSTGIGDGCDYPHGWVDPYPEFYETIAQWAAGARARFGELGLLDIWANRDAWTSNGHVGTYLGNLESATGELAGIAAAEIAGRDLSEGQTRFLQRLVYRWGDLYTGIETAFDGWYPQMIFGFDQEKAESFAPVIADVHTARAPRRLAVPRER